MKPPSVPDRIEARRLILSAPRAGDATILNRAALESYRELHLWMPWAKQRPRLVDTKKFCREAARAFKARKEFQFLLKLKSEDFPIGVCGLMRGDMAVPKFEVGYWLHSGFTGQGYITEAVKALVRVARKQLRVRRLEIRTDARNIRSAAVARRAGFKLEAVLRNDARDNRGRLRDTQIFVKLF